MVFRGGNHLPAIGTEGGGGHPRVMLQYLRLNLAPVVRAPDARGRVTRRGHDLRAIYAEFRGNHAVSVPCQGCDLTRICSVPDSCSLVVGRRDDANAIGTESG